MVQGPGLMSYKAKVAMKGDFSKGIFSSERNIKVRKFTDETEQVVLPEGRSPKMGCQKHWNS